MGQSPDLSATLAARRIVILSNAMSTLTAQQWRKLSPYLEEALGLNDEECALWLGALRTESPTIADQLQTLLSERHALSEEGFMEQSFAGPGEMDEESRTLFGPYTLLSQIGEGGMGTVWLAERNDGRFERRVALKVLNFAVMGSGGEERFKREGNILGRLEHSHIAVLLDAGVSSSGQPFLVLEHVQGQHIDLYCDERRLCIRERIAVFLQVLDAVSHAHANLVVHRDIKPSNVLVRDDGQVKLLDFGIAKLLEKEGRPSERTSTGEGGHALTPRYAAPEQLRGEAVTTATDVYALGALLYELVTGGRAVGPGPHTPAGLIDAILYEEALRPSQAVAPSYISADARANAANRSTTPEKLSRSLRGDLDTIIGKTLKKEPGERYPSVPALAEDLRRYLKSQPIAARPDSIRYRTAKFLGRNRLVVGLAATAALAIVAGGVGTLEQAQAARKQRDFAIRQLGRVERVNSLNELLLSDISPAGKPLTANELLEREEHIVEREHFENPANHLEMLISIGGQYSGEEENGRALRVLNEAYSLSRGLQEPSVKARAACELGWALVPGGDLERAESLIQQGLQELPDEPEFASDRALCLLRGTEVAYRNGNASEVIARAEEAQTVLKASPVQAPLQELNVLMSLASAYQSGGKFREAVAAFERADELMKYLGYDETQRAVRLFNDWGLTLADVGQPFEAEKAYRRAIEISRSSDTEEAVSPTLMHNYSGALRELGRLQEAAYYAEHARDKAQREGDQILVNQAELLRARIYRDQHKLAQASAMLASVEPKLRRQLPAGHYAFASLASDKAILAEAAGNFTRALQLADQAIAMDETSIKAGGQGAAYLPLLMVRRSAVELDLHRGQQAENDANRALNLLHSTIQPGTLSSHLGRAYLARARALRLQGKLEQSRADCFLAAKNLEATLGANHPETRSATREAGSTRPRTIQ
jgi:serine/threonine protein kinase